MNGKRENNIKLSKEIKNFVQTKVFVKDSPPISFDEIVGHLKVKQELKTLLKATNSVSVLLIGPEGVGKTMIMHATSLASDENCFWITKDIISQSSSSLVETMKGIF